VINKKKFKKEFIQLIKFKSCLLVCLKAKTQERLDLFFGCWYNYQDKVCKKEKFKKVDWKSTE